MVRLSERVIMSYMLYDHYTEKIIFTSDSLDEIRQFMQDDMKYKRENHLPFDYYIYEMLE